LCWRLKNRGYKIGACRKSEVYHVGGGTLDRQHPFKTYLNFRNNLYLILKNYRSGPVYLKLLRRMILDGIAGLRFISEGNWAYFKAVLRAHGSFYKNFMMMRHRRHEETPHVQSPNLVGMYTGSIIRAFFIQGKHHLNQLPASLFLKD
ncbi:MAG: glycosyltransferase family 2 protein, partial [Flavobacteriales bacterium]